VGHTQETPADAPPRKVMILFGTRPEIIKLAPVIRELRAHADRYHTVAVASGQHVDLLAPFVQLFDVSIDHSLQVMEPGQSLNALCSRILTVIDPIFDQEKPDVVLVQGDTTTALAGSMAAFHRHVPVGHVEAGLRTDNPELPFPEEMNRRLISRLARYHFAATHRNRRTLIAEGADRRFVFTTGNPVVDALHWILTRKKRSERLNELLYATSGLRRIVLTTHRRENLGATMTGQLQVLREFVQRQEDVGLIFPVHPNPAVRQAARAVLKDQPRIWLTEPLDYLDFIGLLNECWLIVSDSGGIQEEAPTLRKPLLVLREVTERPEAVEAGVARLVGASPDQLADALKEIYWQKGSQSMPDVNPFGNGDSAQRIVRALDRVLFERPAESAADTRPALAST